MNTPSNRLYPQRKSPRIKGFDYTQPYYYSVTICARNKAKLFTSNNLNHKIIKCLKEEKNRVEYKIFVYCLMPSHLHILLTPAQSGINLSRFIGGFKSKSTKICWKFGLRNQIWQGRFYDHMLRKEENIKEVGEYILNNPVRAGIVARWQDYKFSGWLDKPD